LIGKAIQTCFLSFQIGIKILVKASGKVTYRS